MSLNTIKQHNKMRIQNINNVDIQGIAYEQYSL